jgi:RNA polymerase sigma-70 factor (ECF subfamily)
MSGALFASDPLANWRKVHMTMLEQLTMPCSTDSVPEASDESLLLKYRDAGDTGAFEALMHRYEKPLFHYLVHYLRSAALAEEVVQATFLRLYQKCHRFAENHQVRPWLYSIATHLAIDALRKEGRHHVVSLEQGPDLAGHDHAIPIGLLDSHTPTPLEEVVSRERARWMRRSVAELPEPLRVIIVLSYFQGFTLHEVAEILQLPLGTVKSRLHKALGMLGDAWRRSHHWVEERKFAKRGQDPFRTKGSCPLFANARNKISHHSQP